MANPQLVQQLAVNTQELQRLRAGLDAAKTAGDAQTFNQCPKLAYEKINFKYNIDIEEGINDYL